VRAERSTLFKYILFRLDRNHAYFIIFYVCEIILNYYIILLFTVDMSESKTLTAKAVPHANGWVRYNSVSGSSSSSWSRNCTLLSLTSSVIIGTLAPYTDPRLCNTMGPPAQFRPSGSNCLVTAVSSAQQIKSKSNVYLFYFLLYTYLNIFMLR
jgi:hypothetical protein